MRAERAAAGLANVRCAAPDDPSVPARLAGIWSNPPVRIGKAALHELLSGWLGRLAPAARPTWWPGATSAPTRCTAGWPGRAGR